MDDRERFANRAKYVREVMNSLIASRRGSQRRDQRAVGALTLRMKSTTVLPASAG
jgi:metal-responsive CopG/Arc/MetJ family transcriptional regulator